ncbi:FISUMP domain-containing protein [uncultured Fibrobacter sp.]|uniref:FISUMP domain-containing protein n=1 Tax=uncultured Fibrobacter sp. TaxID=261512 RepID=UPI002592CD8D|nr:FISUMP domain-containing protein [uncultured Fibrobacter sp.]
MKNQFLVISCLALLFVACKTEHIEYYEDNKTIKNSYFTDGENGPIIGEYKMYRSDGSLSEIRNYKNGSLNGKDYWLWNNNDTICIKNYKDGHLDGVQEFHRYKVFKGLDYLDSIQIYHYTDGKYTPEIKRDSIVDLRDNESYKTLSIGNQIWMAENLRHKIKGSYCYAGKEENCQKYGRLYTKKNATGICPDGWKIPSSSDWNKLFINAQGFPELTEKLEQGGFVINLTVDYAAVKSSSDWNKIEWAGNDKIGFTLLPSGYYCPNGVGKDIKYHPWSHQFYYGKMQYSYGLGNFILVWQQDDGKLSIMGLPGKKDGDIKTECGRNSSPIAISVRCIKEQEAKK